jgi:hypothetical protein
MSRIHLPIVVVLALGAASTSTMAQMPRSETPQQNVRESRQYEQLVCTNAAFRAKRIAQECGPLQGSQFHDSCVASFNCNHPVSDSQWRQAPPSETIR